MGRIVIPYKPRDVFRPFHNRTERFAIGVAHRRCGKTVACINDKIKRAVISPKEMYRAGYIAPYLKQAKDVAWEYLKRYSQPVWAQPPNESDLFVTLLGGQRIRIYGADNADALRGGYFDDVTLDEYADMAPSVWGSIIRPMLADRRGSATFIGTPKGRNAFHELYERAAGDPEWFRFMLRASETGLLAESELIAARQDMTPEQYEQEFECSFEAAILGAYYGKDIADLERKGRIKAVDPEPDLPVHTAWDLGIGDSTAIWFWQAVGNEIRVLDHYESHGQAIPHYVAEIEARGYPKGIDYVPHDAKVRSLETGRTRVETLVSLGRKPMLVASHKIMDGINAARLTMPRIWFDADRCKDGIEALRQYRADFDEKTRAFKDAPKHDWTSHSCLTGDALVELERGRVKIRDVLVGDSVLTPNGPARVSAAGPVKYADEIITVTTRDGKTLNGTPEHRIFTGRGLVTLDALRYSDLITSEESSIWHLALSFSRAKNIGFRDATIAVTNGQATDRQISIGQFGKMLTGQSQGALKSITEMAIVLITRLQISSLLSVANIVGTTCLRESPTANYSRRQPSRSSAPLSGTPPTRGVHGTLNTARGLGRIVGGICANAKNAVASLVRHIRRAPNSVTSIVKWRPSAEGAASPLVYDLTVEKEHCYWANGMLVSNSDAFRYLCMAWREQAKPEEKPEIPRVKAITDYKVEEMWNFAKRPRDRV